MKSLSILYEKKLNFKTQKIDFHSIMQQNNSLYSSQFISINENVEMKNSIFYRNKYINRNL